MNPTEHMTREERISRVGEILAKGVALMLWREKESAAACQAKAADSTINGQRAAAEMKTEMQLDSIERKIVEYLERVQFASPRDIQRSLSLPKTTVFRKLKRLSQACILDRSGKTSAIRYRLGADHHFNRPEKTRITSGGRGGGAEARMERIAE